MAIAVVGIAALTVVRVDRRAVAGMSDAMQARVYARSAIDIGLQRMVEDADWRTKYTSGIWENLVTIGSGSYTLEGVDPADGDLADDDTQPVTLTGIGMQGSARFALEAQLTPVLQPLDALSAALHCASINVKGGKTLTVTDAPLSTNGQLTIDGGGVVDGDVEAATLNNAGTITGTTTVPAPSKDMPVGAVLDAYAARATVMSAPSTIDKVVIGPNVNPWGLGDPDGLYLITLSGGTLTIRESLIRGTLVVQTNGGKVVLDKTLLMQNARSDYPVLIVDGDVEMSYESKGALLSELTLLTNFNPIGSPILGAADLDLLDVYPSEVQGLVHLTGDLKLTNTALVRGAIICEGAVIANNDNEIVYDANLFTSPPWHYTKSIGMSVVNGSWRHIVD